MLVKDIKTPQEDWHVLEINTPTASPTFPTRRSLLPRKMFLFGFFVFFILIVISFIIFLLKEDNNSEEIIQQIENTKMINVYMKTKRASMNQSEVYDLQIHAIPQRDKKGKLSFNGRVSFKEISTGLIHNYTLINQTGYYTQELASNGKIIAMGCLDPSQIPPFHELEDQIQQAKVVYEKNATIFSQMNCQDGKLIKIMFAQEPYIFCSKKDNLISLIESDDIEANFAFDLANSTEAINLSFPKVNIDGDTFNCQQMPSNIRSRHLVEVMQDKVEILFHKISPFPSERRKLSFDRREDTQCGCKGERRPCLFIHGMSNKDVGPLVDDFSGYWGKVKDHSPCCSSFKFARFDTIHMEWYNDKLQEQVCDALSETAYGYPGTKEIENVIVVSHSMGNLMLAGAILNKKCSLSKDSVDWVSLQGPVRGTKTADLLKRTCSGESKGLETVIGALGDIFGQCPTSTALNSLVSENGEFSSEELKDKYEQAKAIYGSTVSAALCGVSSSGLISNKSAAYKLIELFSGHASENDGVVEMNSCAEPIGTSKFLSHYEAKFYRAAINHEDGRFVTGDGWWGDDRKPLKWFECLL